VEPQGRASPPLAHPEHVLHMADELAPAARRQAPFASTPCSIAVSRLRSATSFCSLVCSS
jgi:hypothetical protein